MSNRIFQSSLSNSNLAAKCKTTESICISINRKGELRQRTEDPFCIASSFAGEGETKTAGRRGYRTEIVGSSTVHSVLLPGAVARRERARVTAVHFSSSLQLVLAHVEQGRAAASREGKIAIAACCYRRSPLLGRELLPVWRGEEKRGGRCRQHAPLASNAARWIATSRRAHRRWGRKGDTGENSVVGRRKHIQMLCLRSPESSIAAMHFLPPSGKKVEPWLAIVARWLMLG
nr:hypothetical protein Iba_chr14cCG6340 [Ipomoea batatas]